MLWLARRTNAIDRGQGQGCAPEQHACDQEGAEGPVEDRLRQHDRIERGDDQNERRGREPAEQQDAPTPCARQREAGPAQERKRQQDRILRHPIEDVGRDQPRRDAADHAAGGHPEVEAGEISRRRARARQFAMAHQRVDEEHHEMNRDQPEDGLERIEDEHGDEADDEDRLHGDDQPVRNDRAAREHDDEGQEVERERKHPQQRHRRDIGGDVRGHRHQQARRHRRERHPGRGVAPGRRRVGRVGRGRRCRLIRGPPQQNTAGDQQRDQQAETERPDLGLVAQPHEWLDHARIGHECEEASDIAGGVEEIGVFRGRMIGAREPRLQQRAVGGEGEERQADRGREQAHQP